MAQAMHVEDEKPLSPLERIWREIRTHGLETHVAELDSQGYTVIPPKLACPGNLDEQRRQVGTASRPSPESVRAPGT